MNDDNLINDCAANLLKGNSILFQSDTNWTVGCYSKNGNCIQKLKYVVDAANINLVLLVNSISMLKNHVSSLHPRIETLLLHHKRPLTIIYEKATNLPFINSFNESTLAIRLIHDSFCDALINKIGQPILTVNIEEIRSISATNSESKLQMIKSKVDYICPYSNSNLNENTLSVMASYTQEGELLIIRP